MKRFKFVIVIFSIFLITSTIRTHAAFITCGDPGDPCCVEGTDNLCGLFVGKDQCTCNDGQSCGSGDVTTVTDDTDTTYWACPITSDCDEVGADCCSNSPRCISTASLSLVCLPQSSESGAKDICWECGGENDPCCTEEPKCSGTDDEGNPLECRSTLSYPIMQCQGEHDILPDCTPNAFDSCCWEGNYCNATSASEIKSLGCDCTGLDGYYCAAVGGTDPTCWPVDCGETGDYCCHPPYPPGVSRECIESDAICQNDECVKEPDDDDDGPVIPGYDGPIIEDFASLIAPIVKILYLAGIAIGVAAIIYSGYLFMLSQGNPQQVEEGSNWLTSAVVGILFILLSAAIFRVIITSLLGLDAGF